MSSVVAVREVFGYLDSPSTEVSDETRAILHRQLSDVKDGWLVAGLINYFLECNSSNALDLLLSAPDHHDRHVLQHVCEGLKHTGLRFQYSCLLFHGIKRNPAPSWVRKLTRHAALKELLSGLDASAEANTLVAGVMVVIVLVTAVPHDVARYCITPVLDMFWRMVHWSPKKPQDSAVRDYLRVSLYSLFTRLYALFPCNVVNYIRGHTLGMTNKPFFFHTLQPMIERVRLHPMLFTCTKEQELDSKTNATRDFNQTMLVCGRLSLDSVETSCEEHPIVADPEVCSATYFQNNKCWVHATSVNCLWSPADIQSPTPVRECVSSAVQTTITTPIYTKTPIKVNTSFTIPESPPEAAIEATPETTPFTTPLLSDYNRHILSQTINLPIMSPVVTTPQTIAQPEESTMMDKMFEGNKKTGILSSRLDAVKRDRQEWISTDSVDADEAESTKCTGTPVDDSIVDDATSSKYSTKGDCLTTECSREPSAISSSIMSISQAPSSNISSDSAGDTSSVSNKSADSGQQKRVRKRSVFSQHPADMLQFTKGDSSVIISSSITDEGLECDPSVAPLETSLSEEKDFEIDETRKLSTEETNDNEGDDLETNEDFESGLGAPSVASLTELVKTAKSNRLRFLSHCGPPLNISQIESILPEDKQKSHTVAPRLRSKSCSSGGLFLISSPEASRTTSPITETSFVKGTTSIISKKDADTQTQCSSAFDMYDKLIESFLTTVNVPSNRRYDGNRYEDILETKSPHVLLENYIHRKIIGACEPLADFKRSKVMTADTAMKNQIYAMFSLLSLERHKREVHATRNRRLLAKTKRIHELYEEKKGLTSKLESYVEDIQTLKSANLFMSSCYQRMKDARDRDNSEKESVLKDYGEGKDLTLCNSVITSLSRTVKTSKGEDHKEKVIVILHRPAEYDEDKLKDILFRNIGVMAKNMCHISKDNANLELRVSELEQAAAKFRTDTATVEGLQHEKEMMRQHMAVMKLQLTLKDELYLEVSERLHSAEESLFDVSSKYKQHKEAWTVQEQTLVQDGRAMNSLVSAVTLKLRQLEARELEEKSQQEKERLKTRKFYEEQRVKLSELMEKVDSMSKHNRELDMQLRRSQCDKDVLDRELHMLASRSGYARSGVGINTVMGGATKKSFVSSSVTSELKPLGLEAQPEVKK